MRIFAQLGLLSVLCMVAASLAAADNGVAAHAHPYHFTVRNGDTSTLYIGYAEDALPVRVADYDRLLGVAWAPDTLTAAVAAMEGSEIVLHRVNLLNGARSRVSAGHMAANLHSVKHRLSWSADGTYVVLRMDMSIFNGAEVTDTTRLTATDGTTVVWSSQRAAYEPETTIHWVGHTNQLYDVIYTSPVAGVQHQVALRNPIAVTLGPCRTECGLRAWSADGTVAYRYAHEQQVLIRDDLRADEESVIALDTIFMIEDAIDGVQLGGLYAHYAEQFTYVEVEAWARFFTREFGPRAPLQQFEALYRVHEDTGEVVRLAAPFARTQIIHVDAPHALLLVADGDADADTVLLMRFDGSWSVALPWDAASFWVTEDGQSAIVRGAAGAYHVTIGGQTVEQIALPRASDISRDGAWYIQDRRGTSRAQAAPFVVAALDGSRTQYLNIAGMGVPRWHDTVAFPARPDLPRTASALGLGLLAVVGVLWAIRREDVV